MIYKEEAGYKNLLIDILKNGDPREDRTGVGTISIFGAVIEYDISEYFPLFTAKKINFNNIAGELLWFLSGSTNVYDLAQKTYGDPDKKTIWHDNAFASYWRKTAREVGDVGKIYGEQWRHWPTEDRTIDQIYNLLEDLRENPTSRRLMLQSYSPDQTYSASIPACHTHAQFYVREGKTLDCIFYMRSNDMLLGHPYNVASYALLTYILAFKTGLKPGKLTFMGGDCHIYKNHIDAVNKYIQYPISELKPTLKINDSGDRAATMHSSNSLNFRLEDLVIENYQPGPFISAPMAV